jgi:ElaB/YqjD/DUF883 family membrane-anchored ribosome-binding protein
VASGADVARSRRLLFVLFSRLHLVFLIEARRFLSHFLKGKIMDNSSTNMAKDAAQSAQSKADAAGAAMHSTIDKAADPARSAVDRMSSAAHDTVDKLANNASQVAGKLSEQTRRVTEVPAQALDYSKSWIQDKPLEAVGLAMALGFMVGRLTAR